MACPQDLQAARGLKAGELRVSWQRVANLQDSPALLGEPAVTVIVDGGGTSVVGTASATATSVLFDTVPRGRDLAITVALTRQGNVISEVCRIQIRSTQTRTGDRTPSRVSSPVPVPATVTTTTTDTPPITVTPPTTTPLPVVTGLTAAPASHSSMRLDWAAPTSTANLANFRLQRCNDAGCTGTPANLGTEPASVTSRTVTGLVRNTEYHFRIQAVATQDPGYEDSAWSPTASGTTAKEPLSPVTGLAAAQATPPYSSMTLTWTAPTSTANLAEFRLQWCSDAACTGTITDISRESSSATEKPVTGLTRNTEYHFRIQATATSNSDYEDSDWSPTARGMTAKEPLPEVAGFFQEIDASLPEGAAKVIWNSYTHSAHAASFEIEVCTTASCTTTTPGHTETTTTATSWTYSNCGTGNCHLRIRAKAKDGSGYSDGPWLSVSPIGTPGS